VAARPRLRWQRWRRRRLPVAAEVSAGAEKLHETVKVCRPSAWLNTTRAFKPLARHRSYSAVKSAAMTAGCCEGREEFNARAFSSNHAGPRGGAWRDIGAGMGQLAISRHSRVREARWRGAQQGDRTASCIPPPAPARGGEGGVRSSVRVEE
jgi:hypothetical protein